MVLHPQLYSGTASTAIQWYSIPSYIVVLHPQLYSGTASPALLWHCIIVFCEGRLLVFAVCLWDKYQNLLCWTINHIFSAFWCFYTPAILKYFIKYCNPQKSWQSRTSFLQKFWKMFQNTICSQSLWQNWFKHHKKQKFWNNFNNVAIQSKDLPGEKTSRFHCIIEKHKPW